VVSEDIAYTNELHTQARQVQIVFALWFILLSSFGIFIFTRIAISDAMVCLWLTLSLYCYWRTEQSDQPQNRVPHLRDGLIIARVGARRSLKYLRFPIFEETHSWARSCAFVRISGLFWFFLLLLKLAFFWA
jgi:hypothetical protein